MQTLDDRQGRTVHQEGREGISTFSPLSAWRRYGDMGPKPARWSHQAPSEFGRLRQLESEGQDQPGRSLRTYTGFPDIFSTPSCPCTSMALRGRGLRAEMRV